MKKFEDISLEYLDKKTRKIIKSYRKGHIKKTKIKVKTALLIDNTKCKNPFMSNPHWDKYLDITYEYEGKTYNVQQCIEFNTSF